MVDDVVPDATQEALGESAAGMLLKFWLSVLRYVGFVVSSVCAVVYYSQMSQSAAACKEAKVSGSESKPNANTINLCEQYQNNVLYFYVSLLLIFLMLMEKFLRRNDSMPLCRLSL